MAADRLSTLPRRFLGLTMIGLVVALLALCVAFYNKVFTTTVPVTLRIDAVDNSFLPKAEVRLRGVIVGEVSAITTNGDGAVLELALQPAQVDHIPRNVTARLLPKSLFGERFVALEVPPSPAPGPIRAGDMITRDRSGSAVEIEQVFDHLLPLLQAVRPADLANTLGAVNQALSGRGAQLGQTLVRLDQYLRQLNPALPDVAADLAALPKFSDTYAEAAPDLIEALDNLTTTSRTLVEKRDGFATLYATLTRTSDDLHDFLRDNRDNIINLVDVARPTLEVLARYSPEYVCFFRQLSDDVSLFDQALGKGTARPEVRITLEVVAGRGKYRPHQDEPQFDDDRGPRCYPRSVPAPQYPPPNMGGPLRDGSTHPPASPRNSQLGAATAPPAQPSPLLGGPAPSGALPQGAPVPAFAGSIANSAPERQLIAGLVADLTGSDPASVPAWSSLLVGPLLRGAEVRLR